MNRAALHDFRQRSQTTREDLRGVVVQINGVAIQVAIAPGRRQPIETKRGVEWHETLRIDVRKASLPEPPARDATVLHNGHEWKVRTHLPDHVGSVQWSFECTRRIGT